MVNGKPGDVLEGGCLGMRSEKCAEELGRRECLCRLVTPAIATHSISQNRKDLNLIFDQRSPPL